MNAPSKKTFVCPKCDRAFKKQVGLDDHNYDVHGIAKPVIAPKRKKPTLTDITPKCIECGNIAKLVGGEAIYPHRPDLFHKKHYLCSCGAYCGCHPNTVVPLGYPCGRETRQARQNAHAAFDPIWQQKEMRRPAAYKWLSEATGIEPANCHIGMMTKEQAQLVCRVVAERRQKLRSEAA